MSAKKATPIFSEDRCHQCLSGVLKPNCSPELPIFSASNSGPIPSFRLIERSLEAINFRQYGHMEKHSQEEAQIGRKSEVRISEMERIRGGESQKREGAGARKGRKLATIAFFQ